MKGDVGQRNDEDQGNEEEQAASDEEQDTSDKEEQDAGDEEQDADEEDEEETSDEFEITHTMLKNVGDDLIDFSAMDCICTSNDDYRAINLPPRFCQSGLNGRNGSSACTVISVIAGYYFTKFTFKFQKLMEDILPLYVGCIEIGNFVHQTSQFLLVQEAITLLPLSMSASWEENVFPCDLHLHIMQLKKSQFMVVISGCYSVCVVKNDNSASLFDSHSRNGYGALIVNVSLNNLKQITDNILVHNPEIPFYYCFVDIFW